MGNINKLKLGNDSLQSILFDKKEIAVPNNFINWETMNGSIVDISNDGSTITIKKFPANKPFIKTISTSTNKEYWKNKIGNIKIDIKGIAKLYNDGIITNYHFTALGDSREHFTYRGVSLSPLSNVDNFYKDVPMSQIYPWDMGITDGKLKMPNIGAKTLGFVLDGIYNMYNGYFPGYPNNYQMGFIIYDGSHTDGEIIDISDNPIILKQIVVERPYNIECWDAYNNNEHIYHKDKTVENCLIKYKYGHYDTVDEDNFLSNPDTKLYKRNVIAIDCSNNDNWEMPDITDINNYLFNEERFIVWRCKITNTDFYNHIRNMYGNTINSEIFQHIFCDSKPFMNSNFNGKLVFNIANTGDNYVHLFCRDLLYYSMVEELEFNFTNCVIGSAQNLCRFAINLKNIKSNVAFMAKDCSGLFEGCRNLTSYPSNLIDWSQRANPEGKPISSNICYAFEYSGLQTIPSFNSSNRFADNNTIICTDTAAQAFNGMPNLNKIGPIIDCKYINPKINNGAYLMFNSASIQDARIKNLNHGDWHLDGKGKGDLNHGNLPNLNRESIDYLINNLYDLNLYNPANQKDDAASPLSNEASLYCPAEWESNVSTEALTSARNKNWSVYIGNVLKN